MFSRFVLIVLLGFAVSCDDSLPPVQVDGGPTDGRVEDTSNNDGATGCSSSKQCLESHFCQRNSCNEPGICVERPGGCPEDCPGICGCDGKFYCNACDAAQAGQSVDEGASNCKPPMECMTNEVCGERRYCRLEGCGLLGVLGQCEDRPNGCDDIYSPVCGCDGKTYGNGCEAQVNGVNIKSAGECPECATDADCLKGQQWCESGKCIKCDNSGLACDLACLNGWKMYERNGCHPCACAPVNACRKDSDCKASNQRCYAGAFCWDWCPADDPQCCYGNICAAAGCPFPPTIGCIVRGCPLGQQCDSESCATSDSCQCSNNGWVCTEACGGICTVP